MGQGLREPPGLRMVLARLMESTDLVPTYIRLVGWEERSTKECPFPDRVAPNPVTPALILKVVGLVSPQRSLELSDMHPLSWSLE